MKVTHNIALSVDRDVRSKFLQYGIDLGIGFSSFKIDESDSRWPALEKLSIFYRAIDTVSTSFSTRELAEADHLRLVSNWHHGYPEPAEDFGYLAETYDLGNYCSKCGASLIQKEVFRISGEPKWGGKEILQLNWVFDEFFVTPQLWNDVFEPLGVDCRQVLHFKTGAPLKSVVQLVIPVEDALLNISSSQPKELCQYCSAARYLPISKGYFPSLRSHITTAIFKTKDFFGSGSNSHRAVIVSRDLYLALTRRKTKGIGFYPLMKS